MIGKFVLTLLLLLFWPLSLVKFQEHVESGKWPGTRKFFMVNTMPALYGTRGNALVVSG